MADETRIWKVAKKTKGATGNRKLNEIHDCLKPEGLLQMEKKIKTTDYSYMGKINGIYNLVLVTIRKNFTFNLFLLCIVLIEASKNYFSIKSDMFRRENL